MPKVTGFILVCLVVLAIPLSGCSQSSSSEMIKETDVVVEARDRAVTASFLKVRYHVFVAVVEGGDSRFDDTHEFVWQVSKDDYLIAGVGSRYAACERVFVEQDGGITREVISGRCSD